MTHDMAPPIDEAYHQKDLRIAIKKIRQYEIAGQFSSVLKAAKGTLSENTIRAWLGDNKKIQSAYKADKLIEVADKLSPAVDRKIIAYELALAEWKLPRSSQYPLEKYKGIYKFVHDIPNENIHSLDEILIGIKEFYNYFWVRYTSSYRSKSLLARTCDGYTFLKGERLLLVGIGKSASMFCSLRLNKELLNENIMSFMGSCVIEDHRKEHISYHSKIHIVNTNSLNEKNIDDHLSNMKKDIRNTFYTV